MSHFGNSSDDSLGLPFFEQMGRWHSNQQRTKTVSPFSKATFVPSSPLASFDILENDVSFSQLFDDVVPPTQKPNQEKPKFWPMLTKCKSGLVELNATYPLLPVDESQVPSHKLASTHTSDFPNEAVKKPLFRDSNGHPLNTGLQKRNPLFQRPPAKTVGIPTRYQRPTTQGRDELNRSAPHTQSHLRDAVDTHVALTFTGRTTGGSVNGQHTLRPASEIPEQWRGVFNFPYFNIVQSQVIDDVLYTDKTVVVCAPTGSGKTVIFELAIIRLMMANKETFKPKVVYMAPIKALCNEKCTEWKQKFGPHGLKCQELTGDTEMDNIFELHTVDIIITTPEKWDSMTRRWRDNRSLVQQVRLFLIDEIHILNDECRGPTMEAVVSRMKTVQESTRVDEKTTSMRFLAVSATIPNIGDVANWLSTDVQAVHYKLDESHRPVKLRKVVLGFPCSETQSEFKFDLTLNYRLAGIIETYAEQKPTLVFCATRKSTQQGASILIKDAKFIMNVSHKQRLQSYANKMRDTKLRDLVMHGVGYHHAGLELQDRRNVEQMFLAGDLPVLLSTSTLAMGVNLPAHLVVIKSTQHYVMGVYQEYSETQVLQMIGRAGRPQFDTSATCVILTRNTTKTKYENLLSGQQMIESSLHTHLIENLNAEVVLRTITDITVALEWIKSTFLYIRIVKNPVHYGLPKGITTEEVERKLQDWCLTSLNELQSLKLIDMTDDCDTKPTEAGKLMARYCIAFDTMKLFSEVQGNENLNDFIQMISRCKELADIKLRVNERKALNSLNKDKNRATIRYTMEGKVKTAQMKINCLIQTQLGCLSVQDFTLTQDINKIFRVGQRVTKCLMEYLWQKDCMKSLLNSVLMAKCFKARLWENSRYVAKQLEGIGPALSTALVNSGIDSFQKIDTTNPRQLEMIMNRHPPFGNTVKSAVESLPRYELSIEQMPKYSSNKAELVVTVSLANCDKLENNATAGLNHCCSLIIGDADNRIAAKVKLSDSVLIGSRKWSKRLEIWRATRGEVLSINLISDSWVGIDVQSTYSPFYLGAKHITAKGISQDYNKDFQVEQGNLQSLSDVSEDQSVASMVLSNCRPCGHKCTNKEGCAHDCCKFGIPLTKVKHSSSNSDSTSCSTSATRSHINTMRCKRNSIPKSPALKRLKSSSKNTAPEWSFAQYSYLAKDKMSPCNTSTASKLACASAPHAKGWGELGIYQDKRKMEGISYETDDSRASMNTEDVFVVEDFQRASPSLVGNYQYCSQGDILGCKPHQRFKFQNASFESSCPSSESFDIGNEDKVVSKRPFSQTFNDGRFLEETEGMGDKLGYHTEVNTTPVDVPVADRFAQIGGGENNERVFKCSKKTAYRSIRAGDLFKHNLEVNHQRILPAKRREELLHTSPSISSEDDELLCNFLSTRQNMVTDSLNLQATYGLSVSPSKETEISKPTLCQAMFVADNGKQDELDEAESMFSGIFDGIF